AGPDGQGGGRGDGQEQTEKAARGPEALAYRRLQLQPGLGVGQRPEVLAQPALEGGLLGAGGTALDVGADLLPGGGFQGVVDVRGDALGIAAHRVPPPSAARRSARPRWIRDITVPIGTSITPAISP